MKALKLTLIAMAFSIAGAAQAGEFKQRTGCVALSADNELASMRPDATILRELTQEQLAGQAAHLVVYVDYVGHNGKTTFIPWPQEMFIFATASGRFVARLVDLPEGHGWYGPF